MILLPKVEIKPIFRMIWLSKEAKENWEPAIEDLKKNLNEIEIKSVLADQRACATYTADPKDAAEYQERYPELIFRALRVTKKFQGFAHRHEEPQPGDDYYIYYVVSKSQDKILEFVDAWKKSDNITQGKLLGFPECCGKFFQVVWPLGYIDPIYQMEGQNDPHPYCNPLLRYAGLRYSFHIPHSFNCKKTIEIAEKRLELISKEDQILLRSLLSMPMEWDCFHGIAQIKTPLFWIIIGSNPTAKRYVIKIKGTKIPKEAV